MLKFDITQEPPTQQEIEQERERLQEIKRSLKRERKAAVATAVALGSVAFFTTTPGVVVACAILGIVIADRFSSNKDKLRTLKEQISAISSIPEDSELWVGILGDCKDCPECDKYRVTVARQGRDLVMAEADAIKKWPETKSQRKKERELQDARRLLKSESKMSKEN
jgi:hypothetical protein